MPKKRKIWMPHKKRGRKTTCFTFHLSDGGRLETCGVTTLKAAIKKAKQWERGKFNIDKVKVYSYGYKPKRKR